jgi:hypothetical protein
MRIYNFSVCVTSCVSNGLVIGLSPPKGLYHVSINKILKHKNITPHTFVCSDLQNSSDDFLHCLRLTIQIT